MNDNQFVSSINNYGGKRRMIPIPAQYQEKLKAYEGKHLKITIEEI